MRKFLFVFCLFLGLAGCNEDSPTGTENPVKNVELPSSDLIAGQSVTIQGEGFASSDQIWLKPVAVKAAKDTLLQATVTATTVTSIIFTVPTTAVGTFEILLQRGGVKHSLGNLTFKAAVQAKYYSFCYDEDKMELAEIDINTGNVSWTGLKIPEYASNSRGYVFDETKNELVTLGKKRMSSTWVVNRLNVKTGAVITVELQNLEGAEHLDKIIKLGDDKFYTFCYDKDRMELAEIDVNTGNLIWTGMKMPQYSLNPQGSIFDKSRNELVTFGATSSTSTAEWFVNKLDMKTGVATALPVGNIQKMEYFNGFVRSKANKYYTFCVNEGKMELAEIDVNAGNLIWTGLKIPEYGSDYRGHIFDNERDEFITFGLNEAWCVNRLNMETGNVVTLPLKNIKGEHYFDDIICF